MKIVKPAFYISTGLLTALMLYSVYNYFFNFEQTTAHFVSLGYPVYLIYPLATLKLTGLLIIWFLPAFKSLREWVYAGFFSILFWLSLPTFSFLTAAILGLLWPFFCCWFPTFLRKKLSTDKWLNFIWCPHQ